MYEDMKMNEEATYAAGQGHFRQREGFIQRPWVGTCKENTVAEAERARVSAVGERGFTLNSEGDWKQLTAISKGVEK